MIWKLAREIEHSVGEYYKEPSLHNHHFVGRVPQSRLSFEGVLESFDLEPVSTFRSTSYDSWRRIEGDRQLHVILYDGNLLTTGDRDTVYLYAHYEPIWEDEPVAAARRSKQDAGKGVQTVKKLLDERGIIYDPIRP